MAKSLAMDPSIRKQNKIGLALGGGAVLGAAHIGVLQALEEQEIKIDYIAGTSIGSFIGALLAFGKKADEIETVLNELSWFKVTDLSLSLFGLLTNHKLGEILTNAIGDVTFADALIPLAVVTVDISTGEKVVLTAGSIKEAVMASTSIPGIFHPIELDGRLLMDGGVVENLPIDTIKQMGAEKIIAVNLATELKKPQNIIDILINVLHISILNNKIQQYEDADVIIELHLSDFNRVDTNQVPALIQEGYKQSAQILKESSQRLLEI